MKNKPMKRQQLLERIIARLDQKITHLETWHRQLSWTRLGIVICGLFVAILANFTLGNLAAWVVVGLIIISFVIAAKTHNRIEGSLQNHRIVHHIKKTHLARLQLDWPNIPPLPKSESDPTHPFENDINLSGDQSLLQLIDTTQSQQAGTRLKEWLLHPNLNIKHIQQRQKRIAELMPLTYFRDRLIRNTAQADADIDHRWEGDHILQWLDQHAPKNSLLPYVLILGALSIINIATGLLYVLDLIPPIWQTIWPIYFIGYFGLYAFKAKELGALLRESYHLERTLTPFAAVLNQIEQHHFSHQPHIKSLCEPIQNNTVRPSNHLKKLIRIAGAGRWQQGQLLWVLLNALVPWDLFFTHQLNRCKANVRDHLPAWLEVWYELEALSALAHFGNTQTIGTFPELTEKPYFEGHQLNHPLISQNERIPNDFTFTQQGDVVIITGSNMSGKSTFLRTLGTNLCLAYAGAPVLATSLKTGLFRLFTCIKVSDSVIDGISYFYAEVRRLKALLAELNTDHPLPVFFLIDEIFRGTNNRERFIGSRSYIQTLTKHHGLGMVSTHDLELVHLEKEFPNIRNFHFRETIQNNKMAFDYKLHPGPCPTTNALTIMRLEGLPVEDL
ncbi:MAG: hypothetical protein ACI8V2_003855 [Candidatus Latescibacterota bacterium]|jgi:hypothetical protein